MKRRNRNNCCHTEVLLITLERPWMLVFFPPEEAVDAAYLLSRYKSSLKSLFIVFLFSYSNIVHMDFCEVQWAQYALLIKGKTFLSLFKIEIMKQINFFLWSVIEK